jgi:hypothetical protein
LPKLSGAELTRRSDIRKFRQLHGRPGWTQISRAFRATCLSPNFEKHFAKLSLKASRNAAHSGYSSTRLAASTAIAIETALFYWLYTRHFAQLPLLFLSN